MTKLRLDQIEIDPTIQIRQRIDEAAVERYAEAFDELPPPVVYQVDGIYLLSDGMHRLAAANRLERKQIEVEVRQGTRADAEEYAITANTKNAVPLTAGERDEGIRRLHDRGWGKDRVAKAMSLPLYSVERILRGARVRDALEGRVTRPLTRSHYEELGRFPEEVREPLAQAAADQGWNSVQLRQAGKAAIDNGTTPEQFIDLSALQTAANAVARDDPLAALYGALKALAWLKARWTPGTTDDLEAADRRRIDSDLEEYVLLLRKIQTQLMEIVQ